MMKRGDHLILFLALALAGLGLMLNFPLEKAGAQDSHQRAYLLGFIEDLQGQPVEEAEVALIDPQGGEVFSQATSQADGRFSLDLPQDFSNPLAIIIQRPHFKSREIPLSPDLALRMANGETVALPQVILERDIDVSFWIAAAVFIGVLVLIATGMFHNTLATLTGAAVLFAVSYFGPALSEGLFIFDFPAALKFIDWNVIFLIMGMMILIAMVEKTGVFQWLAFFAYRVSHGRAWLLLPILMLITGVASAFLDNVTTMLLMAPISVQIGLAMGINPLALLIPEVMASNVVGVSTLVGTPTNILIGSSGGISFNDFLTNLTPGVLLAFLGLIIYCMIIYRKDLAAGEEAAPLLMEKLAQQARITEPDHLKKAAVVGAAMLAMFVTGEKFHLLPAVTAIIGAAALLVWMRPDIEEMIEAVDWTTLVFFMSLFIVVGAIQEVGLISLIAGLIGRLVGGNLLLAMLAVVWLSALLSTVVANIPFTAAMLPVVDFLTGVVPGAGGKALFYCLSVGAAMGGNGSLIGASANMVTAGIAQSAGYRISYAYFLRKGFPALAISVALASLWLVLRFL